VEIGAGCSIAAGCDLAPGFTAARRGRIAIGPRCVLERGVILHPYGGDVAIGANVFLGPGTVIYGHGGVTIGEATLVSMHCRILSSNHAIPPSGTEIRSQPDVILPTKIGRDVWLGAGVTVLGGVTIGDGCVVGAGAVVTRDLPAYSIAHGVPARVTGSRPAC
jgi:acetyltransferase-like isoleucine patch superfamily enzyme